MMSTICACECILMGNTVQNAIPQTYLTLMARGSTLDVNIWRIKSIPAGLSQKHPLYLLVYSKARKKRTRIIILEQVFHVR